MILFVSCEISYDSEECKSKIHELNTKVRNLESINRTFMSTTDDLIRERKNLSEKLEEAQSNIISLRDSIKDLDSSIYNVGEIVRFKSNSRNLRDNWPGEVKKVYFSRDSIDCDLQVVYGIYQKETAKFGSCINDFISESSITSLVK